MLRMCTFTINLLLNQVNVLLRQILKIRFSNTWWDIYINNSSSWLIKALRKGCFHNVPVMCPWSVIMACEACIIPRRCLGPIQTSWAIFRDLGHITGPLWKHPFINTIIMLVYQAWLWIYTFILAAFINRIMSDIKWEFFLEVEASACDKKKLLWQTQVLLLCLEKCPIKTL